MTNPTSNFGWQMPTSTDLVTDLPADFEVFGQAVDTSLADLKGGTTGQVLKKNTNTDMDFVWGTVAGDIEGVTAGVGITGGGTSGTVTITNDMATTITTNGDLLYGTGSGTYTRRGIGTTGQVLSVSGGVPTWTTPTASTLNISQIASGTLSGANLTLSSLSSYDYIQVILYSINPASVGQFLARINNNSGTNYFGAGFSQRGSTSNRYLAAGDTAIASNENMNSGANGNDFIVTFTNCKAAGFTNWTISSSYVSNQSAARQGDIMQGTYIVAEAVSSLVFSSGGGNWSGGNYKVWGA